MKVWMTKALELLKTSLEPPKHELNELDWKAALSPDKKRLTEHLSAFANSLLKNPVGLLLLTLALARARAPEAAPTKMSKSKSKSKR